MEKTFWQMLATDVDFGSNGKMYVSDWVLGWQGEGKGRLYSFHDPTTEIQKQTRQTEELLGGKIETLPDQSLEQLLSHRDRRVRQEAQFCLIDRVKIKQLSNVSRSGKTLLARLHGIWGVGVMARQNASDHLKSAEDLLTELIEDQQSEIRAQAIKLIGDLEIQSARELVASKLSDSEPRVRYFAAAALNRIGTDEEVSAIAELLSMNADADPIIRHGGIMALTGIAKRANEFDRSLIEHESKSVRLATVVALRKNRMKEVAAFLSDSEPQVVLEAARAIYDCPIVDAMPDLARKVEELGTESPDALVRRVLRANLRIGKKANAEQLAKAIANSKLNMDRRIEAIQILSNWVNPAPIDGVIGDWRPLPDGDLAFASDAFGSVFEHVAADKELMSSGIEAALKLELKEAVPILNQIVFDDHSDSDQRAKALQALQQLDNQNMEAVMARLEKSFDGLSGELLGKFCECRFEMDPTGAEATVRKVLDQENDDIVGKQLAIAALSKLPSNQSAALLASLLEAAQAGTLSPAIRLDVFEVARTSESDRLQKQVKQYQAYLESSELQGGKYHDAIVGGDVDRGRKIFVGKTEVSCVRCHKINEVGGEVGPSLSTVGKDRNRTHILEAITYPNKVITDGYTQTVVLTDEGEQMTGIVKSRDDKMLQILDADGAEISIPVETIEEERQGESSMPADLMKHLDMSELRDLVEFLATRVAVEESAGDFERPAAHK